MNELVYLNGDFIPADQAAISPNDRGFLFADGIYEVIKYYNGKPFRFKDHLERLKRSLNEIDISFPGTDSLQNVFETLITKNNFSNTHAGIYVQITRGTSPRLHQFPEGISPNVYAFAFELPSFKEKLEKGIKVITREDIRWLRCDIKSVALLPNTMLYNQAFQNGAGECVLIRNGKVTEATHSSVFGIRDDVVFTHPLSNLVLPGITRKVVFEICRHNNIPVKQEAIQEDELFEMDELFLSGTGTEIMPVIQVNQKQISSKKPGGITRFIQKKFFEMVE